MRTMLSSRSMTLTSIFPLRCCCFAVHHQGDGRDDQRDVRREDRLVRREDAAGEREAAEPAQARLQALGVVDLLHRRRRLDDAHGGFIL